MKLTGTTSIFGIIGNPVNHSFSPLIHNAAFEALGLNGAYIPMEVDPRNLQHALKGLVALDIKGVNVTIPFKETVLPYLDDLSPEATILGSVNTIRVEENKKLHGFNTDGEGFITSLKEDLNFNCDHKTISILGTGGASRAVALYLAKYRAKKICIFGRTKEKAELIVERIKQFYPEVISRGYNLIDKSFGVMIESSDLLVNTTPMGMKQDDPILVPFDMLHTNLRVFDLVYTPRETKLIQAAKMQGCNAVNGLGMLIHQGALSFRIWLGITPPIDIMKKSIMDYLQIHDQTEGT